MAVRKRAVTFFICFRKRGYLKMFPQKRGGVPTLEETMVHKYKFMQYIIVGMIPVAAVAIFEEV